MLAMMHGVFAGHLQHAHQQGVWSISVHTSFSFIVFDFYKIATVRFLDLQICIFMWFTFYDLIGDLVAFLKVFATVGC